MNIQYLDLWPTSVKEHVKMNPTFICKSSWSSHFVNRQQVHEYMSTRTILKKGVSGNDWKSAEFICTLTDLSVKPFI